ncbi:phosphoribosyltransferase [uncultured Bradyrhizobium sp.]|nr:phosphoribosyltransferase domain-containing protein [uncultured Bradyrhizobium sp.]
MNITVDKREIESMNDSPDIDFHRLGYNEFTNDVQIIAELIEKDSWRPDFIVGIGRGGLVPGTYLSHRLDLPLLSVDHSSKVHMFSDSLLAHLARCIVDGERFLFVDDINDSGGTIGRFKNALGQGGQSSLSVRFAVLISNTVSSQSVDYAARNINRDHDKRWFIFPWGELASRAAQERDAMEQPERLASRR